MLFKGHKFGSLARYELGHLPRAGTGGLSQVFLPIAPHIFKLGRARHQDVTDLIGEKAIRRFGAELDRVIVDFFPAFGIGLGIVDDGGNAKIDQ